MAGVELNPGPITPGDEKTVEKQEQVIPAPAQNTPETEIPLVTEETEPKHNIEERQEYSVICKQTLHPGPINPGEEKTIKGKRKQQDQCSPDNTQTTSTAETSYVTQINYPTNPSQITEEPAAKRFKQSHFEEIQPLREAELVQFAEYITPEIQERMAVMLGFELDKVETLRCKHRENVTGVSLDLLIDWTIRNPQPTNRLVSNN